MIVQLCGEKRDFIQCGQIGQLSSWHQIVE